MRGARPAAGGAGRDAWCRGEGSCRRHPMGKLTAVNSGRQGRRPAKKFCRECSVGREPLRRPYSDAVDRCQLDQRPVFAASRAVQARE
ncbi:hypothetical protein SAMCFNEI73_pC0007 (plasmid) [Sinorhizobium americanum]|uniref:Uncharacterized protein n=1 Tax=Sinorhizobium americanum TaxID=194963 RepID=A0A1L3LUH8_9HYPH|nr:hypothetical protein SAMCFNEI73_pC0007 [Sinorhizobium americanum]